MFVRPFGLKNVLQVGEKRLMTRITNLTHIRVILDRCVEYFTSTAANIMSKFFAVYCLLH